QIGARIGVHLSDRRQALERRSNVGAMLAEEYALAVRRVCANADIGRHAELGYGFLHGMDRAGHDVVGLAGEHRMLVLAVADAEQEETGEARGRGGSRLAHDFGDGETLQPGRALDFLTVLDRAAHDDGEDEAPGQVRIRERTRPDRMLCEPSSRERRLSHDPMLRISAEQAVAKGYHFVR